jgi:predicted negative regulator of RcsB-dependent stress response
MFKGILDSYHDFTEAMQDWWESHWRVIVAIILIPLTLMLGFGFTYWFFYGIG